MYFMTTSSLVTLCRISLATPKFPSPTSLTVSYFSIYFAKAEIFLSFDCLPQEKDLILAFEARKFSDRMLLHDILIVTEDLSVYKTCNRERNYRLENHCASHSTFTFSKRAPEELTCFDCLETPDYFYGSGTSRNEIFNTTIRTRRNFNSPEIPANER